MLRIDNTGSQTNPYTAASSATNNAQPENAPAPNNEQSTVVSISPKAYSLLANATAAKTNTADKSGPRVTKFAPADGGRNVGLNASISVTFSESIKRGNANIVLKDDKGVIVETFNAASSDRISINRNTLKIDPTLAFKNGTKYTVTIEQGAVTDQAGNTYRGTSSYDFTTIKERVPPVATQFFPGSGDGAVAPAQNLYIGFSELVRKGSGNFSIIDASGKVVERISASSNRISITNNVVSINPGKDLAPNQSYRVKVDAGAVVDLAGNKFKGTSNFRFSTGASDTPPTAPSWSGGTITPGSSAPSGNTTTVIGGVSNASAFNITINYTGPSQYATYFDQARTIWEGIITGDLADVGAIDDLTISASVTAIDGVNGVLGSAGYAQLRSGGPNANLPVTGQMQFDSADLSNMISNGTLMRVILHEMGHVLGIGSLWATFGLNSTLNQYSGSNALAAYQSMPGGDPGATYVPLEDDGGGGTANVHWEEDVFGDELMTGYSESGLPMPLSILTVRSLQDLGYTVNTSAAEAYTVSALLQANPNLSVTV